MRHLLSKTFAVAGLSASLIFAPGPGAAAAEPALWQVKNGGSTVYLFGSIHALPNGVNWRTGPIDAAIKSADVLVFEAPLTPQSLGKMHVFTRENGTLPRGRALSRMLSPKGLEDFKWALAHTLLEPDSVNVMRPWFARYMLENSFIPDNRMRGPGAVVFNGVDFLLMEEGQKNKTPMRYFETAEGQLSIIASATPDDNLPLFETRLHELRDLQNVYQVLLKEWAAGNVRGLANSLAKARSEQPQENAVILDKRNRNWMPQLDKMLTENKTFFVTVGAFHLAGPGSVVDMLCDRGWKVQRVKTGPTAPPPACPPATKKPAGAERGLVLRDLRTFNKDI